MKGKIVFSILFSFIFLLCLGCASNKNTSFDSDELNIAIREASNYLNNNIPNGSKLVVLNFQSEYAVLSEYIIDELISNTVNDRIFTVVDRTNLELIQQETNFQMSGDVDDETAVSIGQKMGAEIIVSGAISQMGDLFRLRVRALDVRTAQILGQFNRNILNAQKIAVLTYGSNTIARNTSRSTSLSGRKVNVIMGDARGGHHFWARIPLNDVFKENLVKDAVYVMTVTGIYDNGPPDPYDVFLNFYRQEPSYLNYSDMLTDDQWESIGVEKQISWNNDKTFKLVDVKVANVNLNYPFSSGVAFAFHFGHAKGDEGRVGSVVMTLSDVSISMERIIP